MIRPLRFAAIVSILALSGCATVPEEARVEHDPWEPLNRTLFSVNTGLDKAVMRPVARGYSKVVPRPVRKGFSNFFENLMTPASALNNVLQGKPLRGGHELTRFLFNSTLGIGGLFDVATAGGMEKYTEDFGQTLAVWGVPDGPYVMLPFLGPETLRDAIALPVDLLSNPLWHYEVASVRDPLYVMRIIDIRYRLLAADKHLETQDPYITLRESYLQNREYEVFDGDPPEDDDFLDEFLDEEE